jgi:hypothetical protein
MFYCNICGKKFEKFSSLGAHKVHHIENSKEIFRESKKRLLEEKFGLEQNFNVHCFLCKNVFIVSEREKLFPKKDKYFCSKRCSRKYSSTVDSKKNIKISDSLKKHYSLKKKIKTSVCSSCKKEFEQKRMENGKWSQRKTCSEICLSERNSMKGKNTGDSNGMYGVSPENTKRIKVKSEKEPRIEFYVKSSFEARFISDLNSDAQISNFIYEPKEYRVFYIEDNKQRTYQPDFLVNGKVIEIKNPWNAKLEETKIKEKAFRNQFPNIEYEIKILK